MYRMSVVSDYLRIHGKHHMQKRRLHGLQPIAAWPHASSLINISLMLSACTLMWGYSRWGFPATGLGLVSHVTYMMKVCLKTLESVGYQWRNAHGHTFICVWLVTERRRHLCRSLCLFRVVELSWLLVSFLQHV